MSYNPSLPGSTSGVEGSEHSPGWLLDELSDYYSTWLPQEQVPDLYLYLCLYFCLCFCLCLFLCLCLNLCLYLYVNRPKKKLNELSVSNSTWLPKELNGLVFVFAFLLHCHIFANTNVIFLQIQMIYLCSWKCSVRQ